MEQRGFPYIIGSWGGYSLQVSLQYAHTSVWSGILYILYLFVIHESVCSLFHHRANWVVVNGTKYQKPCMLIIGTTDSGEPIFGNVKRILIDSNGSDVTCMFEFKLVEVDFYIHYHAYACSCLPSSTTYLIKHEDLVCYHPYGTYSCNVISTERPSRFVVVRSNVYVST